MADEQVLDTEPAIAPEVETQAREMGWRPREEFKGAEDKWVDAGVFVERGEHVLPIIKATNTRLREDLRALDTRLRETTEALAASKETVTAIEKYHQEDLKQKVARARKDLKEQLIEAKKSGDIEAEVNLTEELGALSSSEAAVADTDEVKALPPPPRDYSKEPDFVTWKEENAWFGQDRARTAIAYDVSNQLRASGDTTIGKPFLDRVSAETAKEIARLSGGRAAPARKVESGRPSGSGNGSGRSWADLPADAKAACAGFERELVGPNRLHTTVDAWRKSYVEQYFREV